MYIGRLILSRYIIRFLHSTKSILFHGIFKIKIARRDDRRFLQKSFSVNGHNAEYSFFYNQLIFPAQTLDSNHATKT